MPTLSNEVMAGLLAPYAPEIAQTMLEKLSIYLDLLVKWNARTNLTAIRKPEQIVRRHFGESLFTGLHLPEAETLLDFGSGAGFPGVPIQLLRPGLQVTLGESQNKKASFLREVVRVLGLTTEVWSGRIEALPAARRFDTVVMRAVDNMPVATAAAISRTKKNLAILGTSSHRPPILPGFNYASPIPLPESSDQELWIGTRAEPG